MQNCSFSSIFLFEVHRIILSKINHNQRKMFACCCSNKYINCIFTLKMFLQKANVTVHCSTEVWSCNTHKQKFFENLYNCLLPTYLEYQNLFCGNLTMSSINLATYGLKLECICWTGKALLMLFWDQQI